MAATSRTRSRTSGRETGYRLYFGQQYNHSRTNVDEICKDVIGDYGGDHILDLKRTTLSGSRYTSMRVDGSIDWDFPLNISAGGFLGGPAHSSYVNRVLAQSGPITANINLPVSLFELRDLPRMLKHAGDLLHKIGSGRGSGLSPLEEGASATLAYQFGWAPLIQDIGKMLNLADLIRKRQEQLEKAHSMKGLRRKVTLDHVEVPDSGNEILSSDLGRTITQRWSGSKSYKTWGTCKWVVRNQQNIGKKPPFTDAFSSALGLSAGYIPISVWKVMPWSWAIDWFADISNVINANHNLIYYVPSKVCIMRTHRNYWTYAEKGEKAPGKAHISEGIVDAVFLSRSVHSPVTSLSLRVPFLDPFKLSVLGSFAVLGLKRG